MNKKWIVLLVTLGVLLLAFGGLFYVVTWSPHHSPDSIAQPHWGSITIYCNVDDAIVNLSDKDGKVMYSSVIENGSVNFGIKWSGFQQTSDVVYLSVTKDGYVPLNLNINQRGFKPYGSGHSNTYIITIIPLSGDKSHIQSVNATAGIVQVFCNVNGATTGVTYDGLIFLSNVASDGSASISMSIDNTRLIGREEYYNNYFSIATNTLFVSADGYKTETIENVTYPKKGETVTYSVTLTPLLSNDSLQGVESI